uniref:BolA-like protein n=1 Tax=Calcidiscus leptoporus TaxID=127549 RepID=A0A7S0NV24_9EUKA|mmetsp:Transcript_25769/g.60164  ORF Transcript_25769/g.60164 Transcript_25769/m.60164 type:complete len:124 (+) Transcript_25769:10-381(+)
MGALERVRRMAMAVESGSATPVMDAVRTKLAARFAPAHLDVINESHAHNVPRGSETHFKVIVVSDAFASQPLIGRHRLVNATLEEELAGPIHALSIVAKTPEQWERAHGEVPKSPVCMGGSKR